MLDKIIYKYLNWRFHKENQIGDYSYGLPKVLRWGNESTLTIGKFCSIGPDVVIILDSGHRTEWVSTYPFPAFFEEIKNDNEYVTSKGNVHIGNDVWIGYGAKILSGVTIGDGAVVGAGAVVAKNVSPYSVVVGNPGIVVKFRFSPEEIEQLLEIKWWDWPLEKILAHSEFLMSDDVASLLTEIKS